ncbi:hypothetical protein [Brevundimonas sp.]|uniref:hypothetical protein n=1 Tax=Brevundimonas sp. TaxID=1871086 RepID=UPI003D144D7C
MSAAALCVLVTPSAAGNAWQEVLVARAVQLGWPVTDMAANPDALATTGLVFVQSHLAMLGFPISARVVIVDTTATDTVDPGQPASPHIVAIRSQVLVEAEMAAAAGAAVLNAARYVLNVPVMGSVERREGAPYRIHPSVSESPLAYFDDTAPGTFANWSPRWFAYTNGFEGTEDEPRIDMTGRMRPMVHGPYLHLPAGRWKVDLNFTVDPEKAHAPLLFEWGSGVEFCRIMTEIRYRGAYSVSLDRIWEEPDAVQLRIWPAHPVFEGQFGFRGCRVTRMAMDDPSPLTPTDRIVDAGVI